jgi:hypothetical protein
MPKIESEAPNLANVLSAIEDPRWMQSKSDKEDPRRVIP